MTPMPSLNVVLLIGPTGVGKTARAVHLAQSLACPVIALDRVQCHPDLAIGSGRPTLAELRGTQRLYLDERPVSDGVLGPSDARRRLALLLAEQQASARSGAVVLEGGSISLLESMACHDDWLPEDVSLRVEYMVERNERTYVGRVDRRVAEMVHGTHRTKRSMVDEFRELWPDPAARGNLSTIVGYREIGDVCREAGENPEDVNPDVMHRLSGVIQPRVTQAHHAYSMRQRRAFAVLLPDLARVCDRSYPGFPGPRRADVRHGA